MKQLSLWEDDQPTVIQQPQTRVVTIKALSLWQPWGSLCANGSKRYETRSWPTDYRGRLLIHAAKRWTLDEMDMLDEDYFCDALKNEKGYKEKKLVTGALLCFVDLVDVIRITRAFAASLSAQERAFGNYAEGRYAWKLANIRRFEPIPARGMQGLFTWTGELPTTQS